MVDVVIRKWSGMRLRRSNGHILVHNRHILVHNRHMNVGWGLVSCRSLGYRFRGWGWGRGGRVGERRRSVSCRSLGYRFSFESVSSCRRSLGYRFVFESDAWWCLGCVGGWPWPFFLWLLDWGGAPQTPPKKGFQVLLNFM